MKLEFLDLKPQGRIDMSTSLGNLHVIPTELLRRSFTKSYLHQSGYYFFKNTDGVIYCDYADNIYSEVLTNPDIVTIYVPEVVDDGTGFIEAFEYKQDNATGADFMKMLSVSESVLHAVSVDLQYTDKLQEVPEVEETYTETVDEPIQFNDMFTTAEDIEVETEEAFPIEDEEDAEVVIEDKNDDITFTRNMVTPEDIIEPEPDKPIFMGATNIENIPFYVAPEPEEPEPVDVEDTEPLYTKQEIEEIEPEHVNNEPFYTASDDVEETHMDADADLVYEEQKGYTSLNSDWFDNAEEEPQEATPWFFTPNIEETEDDSIYYEEATEKPVVELGAELDFDGQSIDDVINGVKEEIKEQTVNEDTKEGLPYYITSKGTLAEGQYIKGEGFLVYAGARVYPEVSPKVAPIIQRKREEAEKAGWIKDGITTQDLLFQRANDASGFILGSTPGSTSNWHTANGMTLREETEGVTIPTEEEIMADRNHVFKLKTKGVEATMYYDETTGGYWVMAGSGIVAIDEKEAPVEVLDTRWVHRHVIDETGHLTQSVRFTTQGKASTFIAGKTGVNRNQWKNLMGLRFSDVLDN